MHIHYGLPTDGIVPHGNILTHFLWKINEIYLMANVWKMSKKLQFFPCSLLKKTPHNYQDLLKSVGLDSRKTRFKFFTIYYVIFLKNQIQHLRFINLLSLFWPLKSSLYLFVPRIRRSQWNIYIHWVIIVEVEITKQRFFVGPGDDWNTVVVYILYFEEGTAAFVAGLKNGIKMIQKRRQDTVAYFIGFRFY